MDWVIQIILKIYRDFGPEDEIWETSKHYKIKLKYESINDGSFWMTFTDWITRFNYLYICKIFGPNWSQYCIPGQWEGSSSGGGNFHNKQLII